MPDSATTTTPGRDRVEQLEGPLDVDAEVPQIAVVDTDDRGAGTERRLELGAVVDLDEHVEPAAAGLIVQSDQLGCLEGGDDQQHGRGARGDRLIELVGVDDEVLAKQRQRARGVGLAEVLERSVEAALLGQDGDRRRPARARRRGRSRRRSIRAGSGRPRASGACARR